MRVALTVAVVLVMAGLLVALVGVTVAPLTRTCSADLGEAACEGAVDAALRRGLPTLHPLILGAHVEPGPAPGAEQLGHRATVAFDLLGMPGAAEVELHYDAGGHWGGVLDRDATEIAAWTSVPLVVFGLLAAAIVGLAWRRRQTPTP